MRLPVLAGLLAGLLASTAVSAQQNPAQNPGGNLAPPPKFLGRDLQALCDGAEGSVRLAGCLRYLQASVAMYELAVTEKELAWFCAPREAPAAMLRQQFVEWAKENGDQLGQDAIQTVRLAMTDAYPCQE
jgi:hypothetical protein